MDLPSKVKTSHVSMALATFSRQPVNVPCTVKVASIVLSRSDNDVKFLCRNDNLHVKFEHKLLWICLGR
jgi:hypothetical protein